jgi:K+-sensing histidine kinase KdpD
LKNAGEASPDAAVVEIEIAREGAFTKLLVRNKGAVPRSIRDRFFEKYSTKGKANGTGLGNYSARLIARSLGGDIAMSCSDELDETCVTVSLRTCDEANAESAPQLQEIC